MKTVTKRVNARELHNVINGIRKKQGLSFLTWEGFKMSISTRFLQFPSLELRWHDMEGDVDTVYVLDHKELANSLSDTGESVKDDTTL
uniref:Uncharacterized protein n=1 Tax=viral metagenome TaxID=1070528 RepID=A0A6M3IYL5_9ZZZZ